MTKATAPLHFAIRNAKIPRPESEPSIKPLPAFQTSSRSSIPRRLANMSGLADADQKELQTFLDAEQAKARVQSSIHTFTDRCWDQCIKSSIGSSFGRGEEACLSNCVERFLDTSLFIVNKLQEQRGQMS
ncbi:mitochondrial import inner membrane translocase subunit TIM8 [Moesziomyces antarcticus]|uniref:mitochondrial import inner membrane translocase subunit TIM8 n=1 Tax=Pseudozyma antarctica TaxID=84753 RepID=UPI0007196847|nr:mitochondrial import inner membrane translocase subunit TIM8 [Moesziomyces antarcticus]GAK61929.1 mitochondrial import inner membrane translocase subunit TIM8 [Moesziomyces antarcticus]